jgi:hypothetical protein
VIKFIPTPLLILFCSLPAGVTYSADAPDGTVRIAAISALDPAAVPKAAPHTATPYPDAPGYKTAAPARAALDLRPPDLRAMQWPQPLLATVPADLEEPQSAAVVVVPSQRSDINLSRVGIGSLYWAAGHPAQAWRVLLPMQPGDESDAYADIRTVCAVAPSASDGPAACP